MWYYDSLIAAICPYHTYFLIIRHGTRHAGTRIQYWIVASAEEGCHFTDESKDFRLLG